MISKLHSTDEVEDTLAILEARDLGIAEFHAMQLPLAALIRKQADVNYGLSGQVETLLEDLNRKDAQIAALSPPVQPTELVAMAETHAKWLEQVAAEIIKDEGRGRWINTCLEAAAFLRRIAHQSVQPTEPVAEDEWNEGENAAMHILAVMLDGETDEFLAWYKPEQWVGMHRAVAGFLKAREAPVVPVAEVELMCDDLATYAKHLHGEGPLTASRLIEIATMLRKLAGL